jgi:hypothetical protein
LAAESKYISDTQNLTDERRAVQRGMQEHPSQAGRRIGETVMTKAKARARAKARTAAKAANPAAKGAIPETKVRKGYFDAKSDAMRNIGGGANVKTLPGMQRGAARSR